MNKKTLFSVVTLFFYAFPLFVRAQTEEAQRKYTAFDMRSNGKIYVLVACILIIMIGLLLYMARLDRKMTRVEKEAK